MSILFKTTKVQMPTDVYTIESRWMSGDADAYETFIQTFNLQQLSELDKVMHTLQWLKANPKNPLDKERNDVYANPYYDFRGDDDGREVTDVDWFDDVPHDVTYEGYPAKLTEVNVFYYDENGDKWNVEYIPDEEVL